MPEVTIVYWRDIPAQVIVRQGRENRKVMLSQRFQEAVDRAAMRAGKGSSDAYLEDWRRESRDCEGDPAAEAQRVAAELEARFSDADLEKLIKAGGVARE